MPVNRPERIGLLGGSFNPPHIGHVEICKYLLNQGACDSIWVMPCFRHPFGKPLAPFDDRLAMCRFSFQEFREKVWVSDLERMLGGISHTVRTLQHLKYKHSDKDFALVIGEDVSRDKEDWKEFDRIKELVSVIEIPRGGNSPIVDVNSTEIRRRIRSGEKFEDLVVIPVAVYIVTHALYHD